MRIFFDRTIKPYIIQSGYVSICEIGAKGGDSSDRLLSVDFARLSIIDPCIDANLCKKYEKNERVKVYKGLSLEILPIISGCFDCFIIDGDHNWYTVYNELKTIHVRGLLKKNGTIFFHDVCWPYGRRDMYYIPDSIPKEFRHSYAKQGIERDRSSLSDTSTLYNDFNNAIYEGGPRNGVLTAIEDFLKEHEKEYLFFILHKQFGLGVLIKKENIITWIRYLRWLLKARYYEYLPRVAEFCEIRLPSIYKLCAPVAKYFNIKRWY